ncbi:MAG: bifunctional 5,10-methylenetetrahydrofolate dehydrogenase/5,10-methenyltetrahydrofolate cyclohydrolase [Proteobacteria bacterium]|nr:bifunctional 5,10-methylenetetrahydrofolate dehydrogenase/5,10-methenyltetrahydrofolate cyclohydrolase [Pseudomonadota bacterium]MDA1022963.1 bifunctional 5,10-methylenetetrahydrofolate dehydrogenase/5,10-methenyltetrahydrofolate cyclohydrolase [Pseudomonadota bacterium]
MQPQMMANADEDAGLFRHKIIDGKAVAKGMRAEIAVRAARLIEQGLPPKIASISIGDNPSVDLYIRNQKKAAASTGIDFEHLKLDLTVGEAGLIEKIKELNATPSVTGIITQRPLAPDISIKKVQVAIDPTKDIEGMNPASIGNIVYNDLDLGPCTAVAAVELLKSTPLNLQGLEVVMVGHSEIVGKPVAFLLMSEGATVTVCHHMTRNLAVHTRRADAVFVAVGKVGLLTGDMIKPGAAVIDIGINRVTSSDGTTVTVGDVDFDSCAEVAGWITPVPGGVGPVTVAALLRNAVVAAERMAP